MKHVCYYLVLLFILFFAGCKDDDSVEDGKVYPTETQFPFDVLNCKGHLAYNEMTEEWSIMAHLPDITYGDEEWALLVVKDMPEKYKEYEGEIIFSGTALYLYYEALNEGMTKRYVYSLQLSEMSPGMDF